MWDGYVGRWYLFVAHGVEVASYLCNLFLVCLLFFPYHPYILLISLEIFFVLLVILKIHLLFLPYYGRWIP